MMSRDCIKTKIVVFDLDETLGYFSEFGMIWEAILSYLEKMDGQPRNEKNQQLFNALLDLFPEFLRPNILNILEYIKQKKIKSKCNKLILYTNNQGPTEWAKSIISYFETKTKINNKLFDQIIAAYKVNGKQVEMCRTTHSKTHDDLLKCVKLPKNTEICFLDDIYHPGMDNENIYYINVKAYKHDLSFAEIIRRLLNSNVINVNDEKVFKEYISNILIRYHYSPRYKSDKEQHTDMIISKKMLHHLKDFFGDLNKKNNYRQNKYNQHKHNRKTKKNDKNKNDKNDKIKNDKPKKNKTIKLR